MKRRIGPVGLTCGLLLSGALWAGEARGSAPVRYTTVFESWVEDRAEPRSAVESALMAAMLKAGATFVDEAQSRRLRSLASAGELLEGAIPEVITSLDADVILAAVVRSRPATGGAVLDRKAARWEVSVQARLIAVDTAQILDAILLERAGLGLTADAARDSAARKAGELLAERVLAASRAAVLGRVELSLRELPDLGALDQVKAALGELAGVDRVDVVHAAAGRSKLILVPSAERLSTEALVAALERSSAGVVVEGYSARAIQARYSAVRAVSLPISVQTFRGAGKAGAARAEVASSLVATALLASGYLERREGASPARGRAREVPADLLTLEGSLRPAGRDAELAARVRHARTGRIVLERQAVCEAEGLGRCAVALGDAMARALLPSLYEQRHLLGLESLPNKAAESPPLVVAGLELLDVFPARRSPDRTHPLGSITVANEGSTAIAGALLSARLRGFQGAPVELPVPEVAPGARVSVPLALSLDEARLGRQHEGTSAVLELVLGYQVGGRKLEQRRAAAVTVLDRNAVDWRRAASSAAFVTSRNPAVRAAADAASASVSGEREGHPLARPASLFSLLGGLTYQRDAVHPGRSEELDSIQFPAETLARGRGDCEDLAVLYAALAEAAGLRAMLVIIPGHVLAAVETELPAQGAHRLSLDPDRVLVHGGRAYVPVETTKVGATFADAWSHGSRTLAKLRASQTPPVLVEVRAAWGDHPPVDLFVEEAPRVAVRPISGSQLAAALASLDAERHRGLEAALAAVRARSSGGEPASADDATAEGAILVALGRLEEARARFERALAAGKASAALQNDAANLRLLAGDARGALGGYRAALALSPASVRIHLNAATAAHVAREPQSFTEHVADALDHAERSGEQRLVGDFLAGLGGQVGVRGEAPGREEVGSLAHALREVLRARGGAVAPPTTTAEAEGRGVRLGVSEILFWLGL